MRMAPNSRFPDVIPVVLEVICTLGILFDRGCVLDCRLFNAILAMFNRRAMSMGGDFGTPWGSSLWEWAPAIWIFTLVFFGQ